MSTHRMLVFTNPVEGREDEFHDWYDNVHIPDVLDVDGITAVTRYEVSHLKVGFTRVGIAERTGGLNQRYLAVWEIEGELQDMFVSARNAFAEGRMRMSDVFTDAEAYIFSEIRAPVTSAD